MGKRIDWSEVAKRDNRRSGNAMAAGGAVVGGTGLVAGGVPGVKEADGLEIFNTRGKFRGKTNVWDNDPRAKKHVVHPSNIVHNARKTGPLPRAGILGFRASVHQGMIDHINQHGRTPDDPRPSTPYEHGRLKGIHEAETKVVNGMRKARKASYGLTIGGGALVAAGLHRRKQVEKRDNRQRGKAAGDAGAVAGGAVGARVGVSQGGRLGVALVDRNLRREYAQKHGHKPVLPKPPKGWKTRMSGGSNSFVRQTTGLARGIKGGVVVGGGTLGVGGYEAARGKHKSVEKRETRATQASSAAVGGGAALAGVGHFVPKGLKHFERGYTRSAQGHVLAAQKLVPELGGLEVRPEKKDPRFGNVIRPAKTTINPAVRGPELAHRLAQSKAPDEVKNAAGRHRAISTQERHFVDVFRSTGKAIGHARGPGLALAGAGATGLWADRERNKVHKRSAEFNEGTPYERYSAESQRRKTALSGAAYGGVAAAAGGAGTALSTGKWAGTPTGQRSLAAAHASLKAKDHPLASQVSRLKSFGAHAAAHRGKYTAGVVGAATIGGGAKTLQRFRNNEEQGMSQSIGRLRAGEAYNRRKVSEGVAKSMTNRVLAGVGSSVTDEDIKTLSRLAEAHGKTAAIGAGATLAAGYTAAGLKAKSNRRKAAAQLRAAPVVKADLEWHQRKTSPVRAAGAIGGTAALAYGGSRLGVTRAALKIGMRDKGNLGSLARHAEKTRAEVERATAPLGNLVNRAPGMGGVRNLVPMRYRPALATGLGYSAVRRSLPVRRDTYAPYNGTPTRGW